MRPLIGRNPEIKAFDLLLKSNKSELVAVVGRRRVGKTFLIRNHYKSQMIFEFTGIHKGGLKVHMNRFTKALTQYFYKDAAIEKVKSWFDAFDQLEKAINKIKNKKKKVIFLDELPWMNSSNAKFKQAFEHFWNNWASKRDDLIIVISGSATSWMHREIFNDDGALYHRVTKKIFLQPFTLAEVEAFLKHKHLIFNRHAILELYMVLGGIPFYLDLIEPGESVAQATDRLFFKKNAELAHEYTELFTSLFNDSDAHKQTVNLLSKHVHGLTRAALIKELKLTSSGNYTKLLDELEKCGFISYNIPIDKNIKDKIYKLSDPFTLFYCNFVINKAPKATWNQIYNTAKWHSWSGLAFENVCVQHFEQIKRSLSIAGMECNISFWNKPKTPEIAGAQIDLIIDRADKVINICEMKYYNKAFVLTAQEAESIRHKMNSLAHYTKTKKTIKPILITPNGISESIHALGLIDNVLKLNDLFIP